MFGLGVDELSGSWLDKFMNDTENPTTTYRISHVTGYGTPDEDGVRDIETETLELTIRQLRELIPHEVDVQWLLTSGSLGEHFEWVLLSTHTKNPTTETPPTDLWPILDPDLADMAYEHGVCWHTRDTECEWRSVPPVEYLSLADTWPTSEWNSWDYYFAPAEWVRSHYTPS